MASRLSENGTLLPMATIRFRAIKIIYSEGHFCCDFSAVSNFAGKQKGRARQGCSLAGLVVLLPILLLLLPTTPVLLKLVLIPLERAVALHFE